MAILYNDSDQYCCVWLGNLVAAGHLPQGTVDARSILEIEPAELGSFRQCHFFAGIGGWPYALALADWPADREVWTASCPCQPVSCAGQRKGHADERHLWPALYRLIAKCRPATIFGEQVASKDGREWLAGIRADLEALGYAVGAADLCAASAGAPHIRQRLFWLADAQPQYNGSGASGPRWRAEPANSCAAGGLDNSAEFGFGTERRHNGIWPSERCETFWSDAVLLPCLDGKARRIEPGTFPLVTRLPEGMGSDRPSEASPFRVIRDPKTGKSIGQAPSRVGMLRGYGNSIVPQIAAEFVRYFMQIAYAANS